MRVANPAIGSPRCTRLARPDPIRLGLSADACSNSCRTHDECRQAGGKKPGNLNEYHLASARTRDLTRLVALSVGSKSISPRPVRKRVRLGDLKRSTESWVDFRAGIMKARLDANRCLRIPQRCAPKMKSDNRVTTSAVCNGFRRPWRAPTARVYNHLHLSAPNCTDGKRIRFFLPKS